MKTNWLPFGSSDEDVVFACDLKSEASITDLVTDGTLDSNTGAYPAVANTTTFDSEMGMKVIDEVGNAGGYRLELKSADYDALEIQGQCTFQVRKKAICCDADSVQTDYSEGFTHPAADEQIIAVYGGNPSSATRYQLATRDVAAPELKFNAYWRVSGSTIDEEYLLQKDPSNMITGPYLHTDAFEGEWVTVNIGWTAQVMYYSLDNCISYKQSRPTNGAASTPAWQNIVLGNRESTGSFYSDYIRNFQIAKRAPIFATHPTLRHVYAVSDSIFDANHGANQYRNCAPTYGVVRTVESKGYRLSEFTIDENPGSGWTVSGVNPSLDTATDTAIATNPSFIFMIGGHNDCNSEVAAATTFAVIQDCIERAMGVNSNPATTVQGVVIGTISSFKGASAWQTTAIKAVRDDLNVLINTIENWWDTTYPAMAGRVQVVDTYDAWGGENTPDRYFMGSISGAFDNVHDAGVGNRERAKLYGNKMMDMLSLGQKPQL